MAQNVRNFPGDVIVGQDPRPDGIINIVVYIGDLITSADDLPFQGPRPGIARMSQNSIPDLMGQV